MSETEGNFGIYIFLRLKPDLWVYIKNRVVSHSEAASLVDAADLGIMLQLDK